MRLVMMGTGSFARPTFEELLGSSHEVVLLVTQPDRTVGQQRGSTRLAEQGMKDLALRHHVPVYQPESLNTPEGVQTLVERRPDLLVVAAYGQILSRDVLAAAALGGINVHASLLPKYRGAAPIAWAIYHGEKRTGVSIIRMSIHLDAGEILAQEAVDILPQENAGELEARLGPLGARLALDSVNRLAAGSVAGTPQDRSLVTKAPKLTKEHGLVDWSRSADQICNQVRAMQPWPTAYTFLHRSGKPSMRLQITRAEPAVGQHDLPPGAVILDPADESNLVIAAGTGRVMVLELQPAGKRRMSAAEFRRGNALSAGDRLGPDAP
jgi:methionyl-tRNA formyltransferase